jgi:hypothetical protein
MRVLARHPAPLTPSPGLRRSMTTSLRSPGLDKIARSYPHRASRRVVLRALSSQFFPRFFMARNFWMLTTEPGWRRLPSRLRRVFSLRLLLQRSRFFLEVATWRTAHDSVPPTSTVSAVTPEDTAIASYCDHCGQCCEIASGWADFPEGIRMPAHWMRVFGQGLGHWHRFCPFLWEDRLKGHSFCAIHPWRPLACRAFEKEECDYLKKDTLELPEG